MPKVKKIAEAELQEILKLEWVPVQLVKKNIPTIFKNIPKPVLNSVYASGTVNNPRKLPPGIPIPAGELIGGIDVYRNAPEDPVNLNKDWYALIRIPGGTDILIAGPINDHEHWLNAIPTRLKGAQILGVPPSGGKK